jgi:hypothetical protein
MFRGRCCGLRKRKPRLQEVGYVLGSQHHSTQCNPNTIASRRSPKIRRHCVTFGNRPQPFQ